MKRAKKYADTWVRRGEKQKGRGVFRAQGIATFSITNQAEDVCPVQGPGVLRKHDRVRFFSGPSPADHSCPQIVHTVLPELENTDLQMGIDRAPSPRKICG
jgi:hypothetical protein